MNFKKVIRVYSEGATSIIYESNLEEEAKYLNLELVDLKSKGKENQGQKYYRDRYKDCSRERDGDWRWKDKYKKKRDKYILLDSRDIELRMKALLSKLAKGQENYETFLI